MSFENTSALLFNEMYNVLSEGMGNTHHIMKDHLMVGDLNGLIRGSVDWMMNQTALMIFYTYFSLCVFLASGYTFWLNDEGVGFYQCYDNFASQISFY